jgi:hypothetical protein
LEFHLAAFTTTDVLARIKEQKLTQAEGIDHAMLLLEQRIRDSGGAFSADMLFEWMASRFADLSPRHAGAAANLNRRPDRPEWRQPRFADVIGKLGAK